MMIIGCDFHTRYQTIAMLDEATGELAERRLDHQSGGAASRRCLTRVGLDSTLSTATAKQIPKSFRPVSTSSVPNLS